MNIDHFCTKCHRHITHRPHAGNLTLMNIEGKPQMQVSSAGLVLMDMRGHPDDKAGAMRGSCSGACAGNLC